MIVRVFHSSRRRSTCKTCKALIEFARDAETGAWKAFHGEIRVADLEVDREGRSVDRIDSETSPYHFAYCKHAALERRGRP